MKQQLIEIIKSLLLGGAVGFVFSLFKLDIPAPPTWAGIAGILGILVGYKLGIRLF